MEGENKPLDIDWKKVLPVGDDDPPPDLVVISGESQNQKDEVESIPDYQLNDKIKRAQKNIGELSSKLPDNGAKLRANLKRLEEERERRRLLRLKKISSFVNPHEEPVRPIPAFIWSSRAFGYSASICRDTGSLNIRRLH